MARILWVHSESSEEIEQCISSHHLSRIDWCAFLYLCPWVLCVVVVTHATMFSFIRSFTISLSTFRFVLLFYTLTHIWHLPKQNIRTQIHAHRRSQCTQTIVKFILHVNSQSQLFWIFWWNTKLLSCPFLAIFGTYDRILGSWICFRLINKCDEKISNKTNKKYANSIRMCTGNRLPYKLPT